MSNHIGEVNKMVWQPIASAPRNGTDVLLWVGSGKIPAIGSSTGGVWRINMIHCEISIAHFNGKAKQADGFNPTHWMPLPEPPTPP